MSERVSEGVKLQFVRGSRGMAREYSNACLHMVGTQVYGVEVAGKTVDDVVDDIVTQLALKGLQK